MTTNIQQELMARIASEVLESHMFHTWHRLIFRELISLTDQSIPNVYASFTDMAANFVSDLINTMCLLDPMRFPVFIPTAIHPDDNFSFLSVKIKTVPNIASGGYSAVDVDDVVQCLMQLQQHDLKRSKVKLLDFVPYRLCTPTLVIDPSTFLPAMDLTMTYCYRAANGKLIHPDLIAKG
jgi:hypothetical protein